MAEEFDIGPLAWVKDEIDQALKSVLENLATVSANPEDLAALRFSKTHLYQVSGALDMVGLEGCKRFCVEIEKLVDKLEKNTVAISPEVLQTLNQSVKALSNYLHDLLNGSPDTPTQLFPALQAMVMAQDETVEESELFFPDTSLRAPKDLPSTQLDEAALPDYFAEQRANFQKSLLLWMKDANPEGADGMRTAIENVQKVQQQHAQKTLWWAASAFMDVLSQSVIAANAGVKRLCRRLDQQLKSLSEGANRASGNLLRDVLYYVAISAPTSDRVAKVKDVFELDNLLPNAMNFASGEISEAESQAINQLKSILPTLKGIWDSISEGKVDALDSFLRQLDSTVALSQNLTNTAVTKLFACIQELTAGLDSKAKKIGEIALIEVAAGLNLLEDTLQNYADQNAKTIRLLATQSQRLQDVMSGAMTDTWLTSMPALDSDVLLAVTQQIKDALQLAEQELDTYFRNPAEPQVLQAAEKPLQQVTAAFDMLGMAVPMQIASACLTFIGHFRNQAKELNVEASQMQFELVAESLGMLEFYSKELPRSRPEFYATLEAVLDSLKDNLQQLGLFTEPEPQVAKSPAKKADKVFSAASAPELAEPDEAAAVAAEQITDQAFDAELLDIYLTEAEEVLAHIAQNLQALRVNATDHAALVEVRRGYHTLKGSGRTVGLAALGEVAWAVEKLLNLVMDSKAAPSTGQLSFIEKINAAFAGWVSTLRETGSVTLAPQPWQQQAAALENENATQGTVAVAEEVVIGGTHKISRALFNIFCSEAERHMQVLKQYFSGLAVDDPSSQNVDSRRAAHTLASNAGAVGFKPIEEIARALERWLGAYQEPWTKKTLTLFGKALKTLKTMLGKASKLSQPKPAPTLLAALKEAIAEAGPAQSAEETDVDVTLPSSELPATEAEEELLAGISVDFDMPEVELPGEPAAIAPSTSAPEKSAPIAEVDQELLTLFVEEARELVPQIGNELRAWRANPKEVDHPDALQRALHTLKGSSRMAGQAELGDVVHDMEDRVIRALKGKISAVDFDDMFVDLDRIGGLLEDVSGDSAAGRTHEVADTPKAAVKPGRAADRRAQYLRLRADVLDRLINEAGEISIARSRMDREMQGFKQFSRDLTDSVMRLRSYLRELEIEAESQLQSRMTHLQETNETFDPLEFDRFTRLQELTRMMAESVNDVATIQNGLLLNLDETDAALQQQNRMNRELQHGLMDVRMVPFALIAERLQRIVRQTARELGKRVELTIDGETVEIDRSVLDKIGAPLEHLLRNAVGHGMETPEQRKKLGKPESGSITLKVRQENDEIVLTVTDDGAGIDLERVRAKAIQNGLFAADHEIDEQALLSVIFEPGFSTATTITQISGRGVGLDSVRSDIAALAGRIEVSNSPGQGVVFSIYLPVTLSVAQVVLIRAGSRVFAVPSVMVEQVQKLKTAALAQGYGAEAISWNERQYPLHFLSKLIGDIGQTPEEQAYSPVILLRSGSYHIALHVDEILGNQEVVMKPIGPQLARVPGMIGATVVGDGSIILIVNPVQLANRKVLAVGSVKVKEAAPVAPVKVDKTPTVMVVDDSLTMRKVLSRSLEREGYIVTTAKDGMDALQKLQEHHLPDIILLDIEMPRMDGFELARNIRDDKVMAHIPIIIISSRTAEKHRNVAKELGVNAFLGKPVQDDELMAEITALLGQAVAPVAN